MSIPETLLTFVGAPAAIIAVITLAALGPSQMRAQSRYRPGRPWTHEPAWFIPHSAVGAEGANGHHAIAAAHSPVLTQSPESRTAPVGGASGEW